MNFSLKFLMGFSLHSNDFQSLLSTYGFLTHSILSLKKRFDQYETRGEIFRNTSEQVGERRLHVRLWELLIVIMRTIVDTLGIIIEDIDMAITKVINQNKLAGILELLSPEAKIILT